MRRPPSRPRAAAQLVLPVGDRTDDRPLLRLARQVTTPAEAVAAAIGYADSLGLTGSARADAAHAAYSAIVHYDSAHPGWFPRGHEPDPGYPERRYGLLMAAATALMRREPHPIDLALTAHYAHSDRPSPAPPAGLRRPRS